MILKSLLLQPKRLLVFLFVASVLFFLAQCYALIAQWNSRDQALTPVYTGMTQEQDAMPLSSQHLFGEAEPAPSLSKQSIILRGVFISKRPKYSSAILQVAGKTEKRYHIGESVTEDTKLITIARDHVVIETQGHQEIIPLQMSK